MPDEIHTTHSTNPFATFAPQPVGLTFEGQDTGEKIVLMLRAHIVTLVPTLFVIIFLLILPILVPAILGFLNVNFGEILNGVQVLLIGVFWYLFVFGYTLYKFIFWFFNVYLLTNERIVDFDFKGLLHKETSYALLGQIEDVTPKMIGFFGTFFHYGNIFIQTAATKPEFEFHYVPRPNDVAEEILEQIRLEEGEAPGTVA